MLPIDTQQYRDGLAKWENEREPPARGVREKFEREEFPKRFDNWLNDPEGKTTSASVWATLDDAEPKSLDGATFTAQGDGSFLLSGKNPSDDRWVVTAKVALPKVTALRIEALTHNSMKGNGPGRAANGNIALSDIRVFAMKAGEEGKGKPVKLVNPRADHQQNTTNLSIASSIDGDKRKTGWAVDGQIGKDHVCVFEFAEPVKNEGGSEFTFELDFFVNTSHVIGRPRFSVTSQLAPPLKAESQSQVMVALFKAVSQPGGVEGLDEKQRSSLRDAYRGIDSKWKELNARITAHESKKPSPKKVKMMVSSEGFKPMKHHADGRGYPHFYKKILLPRSR